MPNIRLLPMAVLLLFGACSVADAGSVRHHRRYVREVARRIYPVDVVPPLSGTVGTAIPPEAARFMGYPYNVPGYRYQGDDACFLRVGGIFGPGPSAGRCPFGLDRAS